MGDAMHVFNFYPSRTPAYVMLTLRGQHCCAAESFIFLSIVYLFIFFSEEENHFYVFLSSFPVPP